VIKNRIRAGDCLEEEGFELGSFALLFCVQLMNLC
jgi:hypothetical protein